MLNRRDFLAAQLGAAVTLAAGVAFAAPTREASGKVLALDRLVVDDRYPDALRIADYAARGAGVTSRFSGDLTQLWYEQLDLAWRTRPEALAGITTREGLFVMETLAADHRMRVIFRAEHAAPSERRVLHRMHGPAPALNVVAARAAAGDWHAGVAQALMSCPLGHTTVARGECISPSAAAPRDAALYSWVIAPRTVAAVRASST
jgi:hypothetical protein